MLVMFRYPSKCARWYTVLLAIHFYNDALLNLRVDGRGILEICG
jgi:hypothetical protein